MGRSPCCDEGGLKKGPWTPDEDQKLVHYIQKHGHRSWRALPKLAGLNRCGKSCRLRWTNYLRPDIKRGKFSEEEEQTILNLHSVLGNKWSAIASHLPGRTDNEIKNFWNTHLKKKLIQMGFDPMTHQPRTDIFSTLPQLIALANLKHLIMDQPHYSWRSDEQSLRLQAEAVQMAKLQYMIQNFLQMQPPNNLNNLTDDMGTINLLNSLSSFKDVNPLMNLPHLETDGFVVDDSFSFSHLPGLEIPCNTYEMGFNKEENHGTDQSKVVSSGQEASNHDFPWFGTSSSSTHNNSQTRVGPTEIENSGAPLEWPEQIVLEDPLFHDINFDS